MLPKACVYLSAAMVWMASSVSGLDIKNCNLAVSEADVFATKTHLRVRGDVQVGSVGCEPRNGDIWTTVAIQSKQPVNFQDDKGRKHAGSRCTVLAEWYNNPKTFDAAVNSTQIYIPFRLAKIVQCDQDDAQVASKMSSKQTSIASKTAEKSASIASKTAEKSASIATKTAEKSASIATKTAEKSASIDDKLDAKKSSLSEKLARRTIKKRNIKNNAKRTPKPTHRYYY